VGRCCQRFKLGNISKLGKLLGVRRVLLKVNKPESAFVLFLLSALALAAQDIVHEASIVTFRFEALRHSQIQASHFCVVLVIWRAGDASSITIAEHVHNGSLTMIRWG
jgi:hypothetical protein